MATSPIHHQGSSLPAIEAQEGLSGAGSSLTLDSGLEHDVKRFLTLRGQDGRKPGGVVLDHLSVEGSGTGSQPALTLTTSAKSLFGILGPIHNRRRNKLSRPILRDLSLAINPGEMLLVIGKPGTGCTTLLKTLAGMWNEYKDVQGELTLGGHPISRIISERPQDVIFCDETDSHFPTLTVMETLRFAIRARCPPETSSLDIDEMTTQLAGLVGLSHVLDTKVGDAYIRGVSGGERRRVSLAEALATCARLICLDNPTNGLDSSTALEFTEMMREWTLQSQCVTAMSVYQGSDAILSYFDKVVVMNSGRQVFGGTVPEAVEYFVGLGFKYSPTMTVSDFLSSMSADPDVRRAQEGYEHRVPRTPDELESAFLSSSHFSDLQSCVQLGKAQAEVPWPTNSDRYPIPLYRQAWHCATRQVAIITRDYSSWIVEAACIIVQSLVLGTLFRDQKHSTQSLFIFVSALFYSVLVPALQSMSEFSNTFDQRPLILKHKRYQLYRPIAYSFGLNMTDVVWKIAAIAYNIPLYFLTGFQRTAPNFFIWFLAVYVEHLALSMFFRSVAVFSPNMQRAVLPVGIFFNMYVLYTGMYVPVPQMQSWLGWLRYLNPLYYAFESAMVNEFGSLKYDCSSSDLVPSGPAYDTMGNQVCAVFGSEPGEKLLSGMSYLESQYGFTQSHMWRNIGINAVLFVTFALCCGVGMEMLKQPAGQMATVFYRGMKSVHQEPTQSKTDGEIGQAADDFPPELTDGLDDIQPSPTRGERPRTLTWNGLNLDIKGKDGGRRLLDNLDGSVRSGKMKALMGVSGAGKTTLLNVLAGRSRVGTLSGEISIDGQLLPKSFQGRMGYVQQQDVHLPTQTVREALQMTAALRRSDNATIQERYDYVEEVIQWLGMASISEALIGVPGAGLNLEQRKKVSIGVEMAAKPEILLLDEPTSGLDGQSARSIIQLLRRLADSGQAVVCTIHQPAAELIASFDELHLLARGGRLAYDGPLGQDCRLAIEYFEDKARPCAEGENPAEYFLDVIGARSRDGASTDWAELWKQSDLYRESRTILKERLQGAKARPTPAVSARSSPYAAPFHLQLRVVLKRAWLYNWRDADYGVSKLWMNVGNALLNSLSYLQSPTTQAGAYNRVFSSFMSMIVGPPLGLQVQPRFVALRDIFLHREKESLAYHWLAFVISAILVELPYAAVTSLIYWLLWYFPVGFFAEPARAGYSLLMYELFAVFATSLAQLCASLMPNLEAAFAANGFLFMFCNTFAGTLSPEPMTPKGWRWYFKLSPLFYLGEGVTANALYDLPITCEPSEVSVFQPPSGTTCGEYAADFLREATGYLMNPESDSDCQYCRYSDGQSYYIQYGYDFAHRYRNVGIFIGFIAFNFTMVWVMTYLTRIRRR